MPETGEDPSFQTEHIKFVIGGKTNISFLKDTILEEKDKMRKWDRYDEEYGLYIFSKTIKWDYEQVRPYKGDVLKDDRRMYLHLYYNPEKSLEDEMNFNWMILSLKAELESGKRKSAHEVLYTKYFDIKDTAKRGLKLTIKEDACEEAKKLYGYFTLLSRDCREMLKCS